MQLAEASHKLRLAQPLIEYDPTNVSYDTSHLYAFRSEPKRFNKEAVRDAKRYLKRALTPWRRDGTLVDMVLDAHESRWPRWTRRLSIYLHMAKHSVRKYNDADRPEAIVDGTWVFWDELVWHQTLWTREVSEALAEWLDAADPDDPHANKVAEAILSGTTEG